MNKDANVYAIGSDTDNRGWVESEFGLNVTFYPIYEMKDFMDVETVHNVVKIYTEDTILKFRRAGDVPKSVLILVRRKPDGRSEAWSFQLANYQEIKVEIAHEHYAERSTVVILAATDFPVPLNTGPIHTPDEREYLEESMVMSILSKARKPTPITPCDCSEAWCDCGDDYPSPLGKSFAPIPGYEPDHSAFRSALFDNLTPARETDQQKETNFLLWLVINHVKLENISGATMQELQRILVKHNVNHAPFTTKQAQRWDGLHIHIGGQEFQGRDIEDDDMGLCRQ